MGALMAGAIGVVIGVVFSVPLTAWYMKEKAAAAAAVASVAQNLTKRL